jgi:tetratricopeptide (TPR) repeat protein
VCPCYKELVVAAKNDNADPAQLFKEALGACPRDYGLHVEHVFGLTPRWGGSYERMGLAIESAQKAGLDEAEVKSLEGYLPIDKASLLQIAGSLDEARRVLDQAIDRSPTPLLFEERAELHYRRQDAIAALGDANAALEMSHGGWMFSAGRLTRLLVARAWALHSLGRGEEARRDIGSALEIAPTNEEVKKWQAFLGLPSG